MRTKYKPSFSCQALTSKIGKFGEYAKKQEFEERPVKVPQISASSLYTLESIQGPS
jgi:hypothetical protein